MRLYSSCRRAESAAAFVLAHQSALGFVLLGRDEVPLGELGVAAQVLAGIVQLRLVLGQSAQGLIQSGLEGTRVNFRQQLTGLDALALGKVQTQQLPVHPAGHQHVAGRQHRAQPVAELGHVLRQGHGYAHRSRGYGRALTAAAGEQPPARQGQNDQKQDGQPTP